MRTHQLIVTYLICAFLSISCNESTKDAVEVQKLKEDSNITVKRANVSFINNTTSPSSYPVVEYNKVILFSIDSSIYNAEDTLGYFEDGKLAYKRFFGGGAFVDSTGKPIHNRYKKHILDKKEVQKLKVFLKEDQPTEISNGMCLQTYRDVLVFYEKQKVVGQIQMCFHCSDIIFYPEDKLMGDFDSRRDFGDFKKFIGSMRFRE